MELLQPIIHYGLHFIFPALIAFIFFREKWKQAYLIFLVTMLVDLDHFNSTPIFDPNRCSINFHPFHSYWAIGFYTLGLYWKKTRIIAIGLLFHMTTDYLDCLWIN